MKKQFLVSMFILGIFSGTALAVMPDDKPNGVKANKKEVKAAKKSDPSSLASSALAPKEPTNCESVHQDRTQTSKGVAGKTSTDDRKVKQVAE